MTLKEPKREVIDKVIVLKLKNIEHVQPDDICIDVLLDPPELFQANARQIQELKKRTVSFWVVLEGEKLLSHFIHQMNVHYKNVWMNSVHGSLDWSEAD